MTNLTVAVLCVAILAFWTMALAFLVSMRRASSKVYSGTDNDPTGPLHKAIRAHGNTTEYVPILAVLILYLGAAMPAATWVMWAMILVTVARICLPLGLLMSKTMTEAHPLRIVGSLGTQIGALILIVASVMTVI